jgi:sporulation protein YhbH
MVLKNESDHQRFKEIVKGRIKKELRKYITQGEILGKQGDKMISIPLPRIDLPRYMFGGKNLGGVGQGEGEVGQILGQDQDGQSGQGEAGDQAGEHTLEAEITLAELAEILGEELELPKIEPKGKKTIHSEKERYSGIRRTGPESLKHFKRTFKAALIRQLISGTYNPDNPIIIPIKEDKRFRSWKITSIPESNAVVIYMMDVSGSMGEKQKEIVRIESFWIDTWLRSQYDGIEFRYIIHDATAREVDRATFYSTKESGGTIISSAYKLCTKIIEEEYPPAEWNIYPFHFSDGDNWSEDDSRECCELLSQKVLPYSNMFCYGQVESQYGSGQFLNDLKQYIPDSEKLVMSKIKDKDAIYDSIKEFLGKGK